MHAQFSKVRAARGIGGNLVANPLELPAPDVFQIRALGRGRRGFVQVHGDLEALPDLLAYMTRHSDAVFDRDAVDRDERHNVGSTHARMGALVLGQIDEFGGFADPANGRFLDGLTLADKRDHAAVVVGVHLSIQEIDAVDFHGVDDGVDFGLVAAFGEIRNAFHQRRHNGQEYKARDEPATGLAPKDPGARS